MSETVESVGCIVGLVVRVSGDRRDVRQRLAQMDGVEIHAEDDRGRLVLTLETRTQRQALLMTEQMQDDDGVDQVTPVYQYCDDAPDMARQGGWSWR